MVKADSLFGGPSQFAEYRCDFVRENPLESEFIIRRGTKEIGPISGRKLRSLAKAGKLQKSDQARRIDDKEWVDVANVLKDLRRPDRGTKPTGDRGDGVPSVRQDAAAEPPIGETQKKGLTGITRVVVICFACLFIVSNAVRGCRSVGDGSSAVADIEKTPNNSEGLADPDARLDLLRNEGLVNRPSDARQLPDLRIDESFSPYRDAKSYMEDQISRIGDGRPRITRLVAHKNNVIAKRTVEIQLFNESFIPVGEPDQQSLAEKPSDQIRVRLHDGHIETADAEYDELFLRKDSFWTPILKIGASVGDEWNVELAGNIEKSFRYRDAFQLHGIKIVVIEELSTTPTATNTAVKSRLVSWYGQNCGLLRWESWAAVGDEESTLRHSGIVIPTENSPDTTESTASSQFVGRWKSETSDSYFVIEPDPEERTGFNFVAQGKFSGDPATPKFAFKPDGTFFFNFYTFDVEGTYRLRSDGRLELTGIATAGMLTRSKETVPYSEIWVRE